MHATARRPSLTRARRVTLSALLAGLLALTVTTGCSEQRAPASAAEMAGMTTLLLPIEGMTCSSCVGRVKQELLSMDGVGEVSVDLVERNARIRFDPVRVSEEQLAGAVEDLGYSAGATSEPR